MITVSTFVHPENVYWGMTVLTLTLNDGIMDGLLTDTSLFKALQEPNSLLKVK